jgi:hypothetical protein
MVWLQSQIKVGMVFLAGTGVDQQLGLAEVFRARGGVLHPPPAEY